MGLENLLTVEDGARLYVEYCEEHEEETSIKKFFIKYDCKKRELLPSSGKKGKLDRHYQRYLWLRRKNKLLKRAMEFEEWVAHHISDNELERRFWDILPKQYSLEEGVEFYMQYLKKHNKESKPITEFFIRYNIKNKSFNSKKDVGHLHKYYSIFSKIKRNGKLPEGINSFEDWLKSQISERLKQKLEKMRGKYFKEYSLEEGAEFYIQYLQQHEEESKSIMSFFVSYDAENNRFHSKGSPGCLNKYYARFSKIKRNGKLPKEITAFEEWLKLQISERLKQKLEELTGGYFKEYSLEEGIEFYIRHLEEHKEKSKPIKSFFRIYDVENNRFHPKDFPGCLNKYHARFSKIRRNGKLPKGTTTFEDYLISQLPEEKREHAEYYLKGHFLKDVAKAKVDTNKLKEVVFG